MADDNFLAEKEFDISIDGQTHKVKATAVFLVHGGSSRYFQQRSSTGLAKGERYRNDLKLAARTTEAG